VLRERLAKRTADIVNLVTHEDRPTLSWQRIAAGPGRSWPMSARGTRPYVYFRTQPDGYRVEILEMG
jgi:hypothetical protein